MGELTDLGELPEVCRGWAWVDPFLDLNFCLTVVRGTDPAGLADALRFEPDNRKVLTRDEVHDEFEVYDEFEYVVRPVVRIGATGGWTFAFQEYGIDVGLPDLLRELSAAGEAVTVGRVESRLTGSGTRVPARSW